MILKRKKQNHILKAALTLPADIMQLARQQPPVGVRTRSGETRPVPYTYGTVEYAENLRRYENRLHAVGAQQLLVSAQQRPVAAEIRGDLTHILTQSDTGDLRMAYTVDASGHLEQTMTTIDTECQPMADGCRVSDFTALRCSDSTLDMLRYDSETGKYSHPGTLPELPDVQVDVVEQPEISVTCAEIKFAQPIRDLRDGIDLQYANELTASVRNAYETAGYQARQRGAWIQPVAVRVAMRLWDGTLAALSAPQIVGLQTLPKVADNADVNFFPTLGSSGVESSGPGTLRVSTYRVRISLGAASARQVRAWSGLIRGLEVWVSPELETITDEGAMVAYREADEPLIAVRMGRRDLTGIVDEMAAGTYCLHSSYPFGPTLSTTLTRIADFAPTYLGTLSAPLMPTHARVITSHDGRLHLGGYGYLLPAPAIPEPVADGREGTYPCSVAVRLRIGGGDREVRSVGTLRSLDIAPLLWYPDARAREMTIAWRDGRDITHTRTFPLTAVKGGEDAACYASPYGRAISLDQDETLSSSALPEACTLIDEYPEGIAVSQRGNPYVLADFKTAIGGDVRAAVAQPNIQGGYTRQFVYFGTDTGIVAAVLDAEGTYRNVRTVSTLPVAESTAMARGERSVYALSDGHLVAIADGRVSSLLRGAQEYERLMYVEKNDEVWLLPAADVAAPAMALCMGEISQIAISASMRTLRVESALCDGRRTFVLQRTGAAYTLYLPEGVDGRLAEVRWQSTPMMLPFRGYGVLQVPMESPAGRTVAVTLAAVNPLAAPDEADADRLVPLVDFTTERAVSGVVEVPYISTSESLASNVRVLFTLHISGPVTTLAPINLLQGHARTK